MAVVYGNTRNLGAYKFCVVFWPFFRDNRCLDVFFFFFFFFLKKRTSAALSSDFVNHSNNYRPNSTPLSPLSTIYVIVFFVDVVNID